MPLTHPGDREKVQPVASPIDAIREAVVRTTVERARLNPAHPIVELFDEVVAELWPAGVHPDGVALETITLADLRSWGLVTDVATKHRGPGRPRTTKAWVDAFVADLEVGARFQTNEVCEAEGAPSRSSIVRALIEHPRVEREGSGNMTQWVVQPNTTKEK